METKAHFYQFLVFCIFGESYDFDRPTQIDNPDELIETVEQILDTFSDAEISYIKQRFGLLDGELKTHDDLAALFKMEPSEMKSLEIEIMRKLRHPMRSQLLRRFLD
jgi:DNA-directed RNA polymerase sigma subunit (sigma70/sigma32)